MKQFSFFIELKVDLTLIISASSKEKAQKLFEKVRNEELCIDPKFWNMKIGKTEMIDVTEHTDVIDSGEGA